MCGSPMQKHKVSIEFNNHLELENVNNLSVLVVYLKL